MNVLQRILEEEIKGLVFEFYKYIKGLEENKHFIIKHLDLTPFANKEKIDSIVRIKYVDNKNEKYLKREGNYLFLVTNGKIVDKLPLTDFSEFLKYIKTVNLKEVK